MNEIPSPTQTYDGTLLIPASEWPSSVLRIPKARDWRIRASIDAALYGNAEIEVVTLLRQKRCSHTADAIYSVWIQRNGATCPIENLCDECGGKGWYRDAMDRESHDCSYCEGRGWFYAD